MATVSEICFIPNGQIGKCRCCGREKELGHLNLVGYEHDIRCIDCFFGPPDDFYWDCGKDGEEGDPDYTGDAED